MTTLDPIAPLTGAKDVIDGGSDGTTVKLATLGVSAPAPSTVIVPDDAPTGTVVVAVKSVDGLTTAAVPPPPLNEPAVAPVNPDPVSVTVVPTTPQTGVNDVTAAADAGSAVKSTPTTPSTSASAVARADTFFFGNLIRLLLSGSREVAGAPLPGSHDRRQTDEWRDVLESYPFDPQVFSADPSGHYLHEGKQMMLD